MTRTKDAQDYRSGFKQADDAGKLELALDLRNIAIEFLKSVTTTIPRAMSARIRAEYQAKGISLEWDLTTTDAFEFYFQARQAGLTASQQSAAALLLSCTQALEAGAMPEHLQSNILDAYAGLDADDTGTGKAFRRGRKKGALSPIAKRVAAYLEKHPRASAIEVWDALAKKPPKGYRFTNGIALGRLIEKGAAEVMGWPRFQTVMSEQRPAEAKRKRRKPA